jgi:Amt family ammonium transporter
MSEEQLLVGDDMIHGEAAYVFGPCEAHEHLLPGQYIKRSNNGPGELGIGGVMMGLDPHVGMGYEKSSGSGTVDIKHDLEGQVRVGGS